MNKFLGGGGGGEAGDGGGGGDLMDKAKDMLGGFMGGDKG